MSLYLWINIIIITVPLILSLHPKIHFTGKTRSALFAIVIGGLIFVAGDILVTWRGDWAFNDKFIQGTRCLGLPFEEWLFFVTVPYSCLFLYDGIAHYLKGPRLRLPGIGSYFLAALFLIFSLIFVTRSYTSLVLMATGLLLLLQGSYFKEAFALRAYWPWMGVTMLLLVVFNYISTALPVVVYNPQAITNWRIATIPVEDFFYNYVMLTLYLDLYLVAKKIFIRPSA